jgi:hypothetical protein
MAEEEKIRLTRERGAFPKIIALGQHSAPYEDIYHTFMTLSWPAFFALIGGAFLVTNALFAVGYLMQPGGVANARPSSLADAFFFSVQTLAAPAPGSSSARRRWSEGEEMRVSIELPLVRDRTALFLLTWTAMHRIDERSPLHRAEGETHAHVLDRLRAQGAELYLSLSGQDETFGQTIHARYRYDIAWDARFADVVTTLPDGTRQIDYRRFHDVVPLSLG